MATQGQRQDYLFRPTTNDSTNLARYDEQANLWYRAFKSAERRNMTTDYAGTFNTIGLILSLIFSLILVILLSIVELIKWVRS